MPLPVATPAPRRGPSPGVVGAIVVGLVALVAAVALLTRNDGGRKTAAIDTSSSSSSDSSTDDSSSSSTSDGSSSSSSSSPLTDQDVSNAAEHLADVFFSFDFNDVDSLVDRTRPLATGHFLDQLNTFSSDFVSSAQSQHVTSFAFSTEGRTLSFDGQRGEAIVDAEVGVTSDSNSSQQFNTFKLIMSLTVVDGQLLVSDLAECSGPPESLSTFSGSC